MLAQEVGSVHVADGSCGVVLPCEAHESKALVREVAHVEDLAELVEELADLVL